MSLAEGEIEAPRSGLTATPDMSDRGETRADAEEHSRVSGDDDEESIGRSPNPSTSREGGLVQRIQKTWLAALQWWPVVGTAFMLRKCHLVLLVDPGPSSTCWTYDCFRCYHLFGRLCCC